MNIYLAARYSRRLELCGYRSQLEDRGHVVPARWLNGAHQLAGDGGPLTEAGERRFEAGDPAADHLRDKFATDDYEDVLAADHLIAFTEPPRSGGEASRGGRHVELGIAIGARIPVTIVGPRENLFCWLPQVTVYENWPSLLDDIGWAHGCGGGCACHGASGSPVCGQCCSREVPA